MYLSAVGNGSALLGVKFPFVPDHFLNFFKKYETN